MTLYMHNKKGYTSLYIVGTKDDRLFTDPKASEGIMLYHKWSYGNLMEFRVETVKETKNHG